MMVSLPPAFEYPANTQCSTLIDGAILPFCRESGLPFALMIGVKRGVNAAMQLAGDGVGKPDLASLENLCSGNNGHLYANYKIQADVKKFRVSLVPISLYSDIAYSGASKLAYIETNRGNYIVSVSGDISPERKSKILRNVNFSLKKQPSTKLP